MWKKFMTCNWLSWWLDTAPVLIQACREVSTEHISLILRVNLVSVNTKICFIGVDEVAVSLIKFCSSEWEGMLLSKSSLV